MKTAGAIILIVGAFMTVYSGFTYLTTEMVVRLAELELTIDKEHNVNWQPYVGIATMVIGAGVLVLGRKKLPATRYEYRQDRAVQRTPQKRSWSIVKSATVGLRHGSPLR